MEHEDKLINMKREKIDKSELTEEEPLKSARNNSSLLEQKKSKIDYEIEQIMLQNEKVKEAVEAANNFPGLVEKDAKYGPTVTY